MIHFACVQCSRRHKVHESMAGATVKCPCGQLMLVPVPAVSEIPLPEPVEEKIALTCVCGKNLKVPQSAVGKSVRCSCGEVLMVAGVQEEPPAYGVETGKQSEDWLSGALPPPTAPPSLNNIKSQGSPYSATASGYTQPSTPSYTHDYLRHAHEEQVTRRSDEHHEASTELHAARWTLIVIGILTILVNLLLFFNVSNEIAKVAQDAAAQGDAINITLFENIGRIFYGCTMMVGVVFILLGVGVYQFPVAAPAIGLGLYVLGIAMYLVLNPMGMLSPFGIAVKFVIIGTLIKAINSGVYYRR